MSSKRRTVAPQATNGMAGFSIVTKTLTEHGFFSNKFFQLPPAWGYAEQY